MNNAVTILALQDAKLSNNNKELRTLCLRLSINFHSEQVADAPSTIPLNTCLYIYFIFRFRRMLNGNVLESLNETLFNRNNVIDTGYLDTQQRKYYRPVRTLFSDSLLFTQKGNGYPQSPHSPMRTCHSCPISDVTTKTTDNVTKDVAPSRVLSKLRVDKQHMDAFFRELFNITTDRHNP